MNSLINGIIWYGIIQAFFLGFILLSKSRKIPASIFLTTLLFIEAIGLTEQALYFTGMIYEFPSVLGISYPLSVLRPLLIFLFAKVYFQGPIQIKRSHLLHLIPFFIYALLFSNLIFSSPEQKIQYLDADKGKIWTDNLEGIVFFIINNIIYMAYYFSTWKIVRKARPEIKLTKGNGASWIANFIVFLLYFFIFKNILFLLNGVHLLSNEWLGTIVMLVSSFTIQIIAWSLINKASWPAFNPTTPALDNEVTMLKKVLEEQKAYLDDNLTIKKLAFQCAIRQDRLTDLIRMQYGESFKDVINNLRVLEAKSLIKEDLNGRTLNLLGIAMDAGFNNKVTFYRAFKKHEGVSPSEYVKKLSPSI